MATCKRQEHKYFIPDTKVAPLTYRQIKAISAIGKENPSRELKLVGRLSTILNDNDTAMNVLKASETVAAKRMSAKTRIGTPVEAIDRQTELDVKTLMEVNKAQNPESLQSKMEVADKIARAYRKGEVMSGPQRDLVYNAFAKQLDDLPTVIEQLEASLESGSGALQALHASQLTKFLSSAAAVAGDKNAVSVAFKSFERLNTLLKNGKGGTLDRLFIDGAC